jgi:hypothetical protein
MLSSCIMPDKNISKAEMMSDDRRWEEEKLG